MVEHGLASTFLVVVLVLIVVGAIRRILPILVTLVLVLLSVSIALIHFGFLDVQFFDFVDSVFRVYRLMFTSVANRHI